MIRVFGFPSTPDSTIGFGGKENWVYRLSLKDGDEIMPAFSLNDTAASASSTIIHTAAEQPYKIAIPGCYALMKTREEALAELPNVFSMIEDEYREKGQKLPADSTEIVNA